MQSIHNILCEKLNPRSGVIKISSSNDEDKKKYIGELEKDKREYEEMMTYLITI